MKLLAMLSLVWSAYWVPFVCALILIVGISGAHFAAKQPPYKIITIDGCEYIKSNLAEVPLIHKANCPNHE